MGTRERPHKLTNDLLTFQTSSQEQIHVIGIPDNAVHQYRHSHRCIHVYV